MMSVQGQDVVDILLNRHVASGLGEKTALIEPDTGLQASYQDLLDRVANAKEALLEAGLQPGQVMLTVAADSIALVSVVLAGMSLGAIVANASALMSSSDYSALIEELAPDYVVSAPAMVKLDSALHAWPATLSMPSGLGSLCCRTAERPRRSDTGALPGHHSGETGICLFTSGSTGQPKPVLHTLDHMVAVNENYVAEVLQLGVNDVLFSTSKMSFAYGFNSVHFALYQGATAVLAPQVAKPEAVLGHICEFGVTAFFTVPTMYRLMLKSGKVSPGMARAVRRWVSAGENLPETLFSAWKSATGQDVLDGIGTTETLSTFISNKPGDLLPGCTGRVVPGFDIELRTRDGSVVPEGEIGILFVRGRTVSSGYWGDPVTSASAFEQTWFKTNDLFFRDEEGRYHYVGRSSDVFKSGGNWISPVRIEEALRQHPGVNECAVVPHVEMGGLNRIKAFVVPVAPIPRSDAAASLMAELIAFAKARLAHHEYPHYIEFISELPRNVNGKLQRALLRT